MGLGRALLSTQGGLIRPKAMERSSKTAREIFEDTIANPKRKTFGFGRRAAVVNVDLQKAYTSGEFATSYETDPRQLEHVNALSALARRRGWPVVWTRVAYAELKHSGIFPQYIFVGIFPHGFFLFVELFV